jgi:excisionase family DNA binding protein
MSAAESDLLTVQEVARRLRVAVSTVRRYLDAGSIEAVQLGAHRWGPVRISAAALDEALRRWSRSGAPKVELQRGDPMPIPVPNRPSVPAPTATTTKPKPPSVAGWN